MILETQATFTDEPESEAKTVYVSIQCLQSIPYLECEFLTFGV